MDIGRVFHEKFSRGGFTKRTGKLLVEVTGPAAATSGGLDLSSKEEAAGGFQMTMRMTSLGLVFLLALAFVSPGREVQADTGGKYKKSVEKYLLPEVTLVNQDGRKVKLNALLNSKKPVLVDFIFTTCTTICPLLSAGFSDFQETLGPESDRVQLISISIDPEHDTPKAMKAYLQRYEGRPGWDFLSGKREDIDKVLKAFGTYTTDKMDHPPLILVKTPSENRWLRIFGLIGTGDLMKEYRGVLK